MNLTCAVCDQPVHGDMDHVKVASDFVRMEDENTRRGHLFHVSCWHNETRHWVDPA